MSPRCLVVSYGLGTGHHRVADTVSETLQGEGTEALVSHLEEWVPWEYDLLFRRGYLFCVFRLPWLWQWMYTTPAFARRGRLALPGMAGRARRRFETLADGSSAVAATQVNAMEIAADAKAAGKGRFRLAVVLTDYDVYPLWARREVDLYLLPHEDLVEPFLKLGVGEERLAVTGIPVDLRFENLSPDRSVLRELGLEEGRPTVLILGGGVGAGPLGEAAAAALGDPGLQVVLVCGRNERLRRSLVPLAQAYPQRLRVLGYRTDLPRFLAACDVVVTKGGGLTLTEALTAGKRCVVLPGLPGQERANTAFMAARGWVSACEDLAALPRHLRKALEGPEGPRPLPRDSARRAARLLGTLARGD
ncbi:MAG: MGDG synthase family glycosyltransferase [Acidobacteriota bacterium]